MKTLDCNQDAMARSRSEKWWVAGGRVTIAACVLSIVLPFTPDAAVGWLAGLVTVGFLFSVLCNHMSKRIDSKRGNSPNNGAQRQSRTGEDA